MSRFATLFLLNAVGTDMSLIVTGPARAGRHALLRGMIMSNDSFC